MKTTIKLLILSFILILSFNSCSYVDSVMNVSSPDQLIRIDLEITENGQLFYTASYNKNSVFEKSKLGLIGKDIDFSTQLEFIGTNNHQEEEAYALVNGKKDSSNYQVVNKTFRFKHASGQAFNIDFRVTNEGFAYRYAFPDTTTNLLKIKQEITSFNFVQGTHAWIQPRASSKSGWNQVNPSYEEDYWVDTLLSDIAPNDSGWIFPVLLKTPACWVNLTETWPLDNYCGSHLNKGENPEELVIAFPEPTEGFTNGAVYPESTLPWKTPWRMITMGSLKTIAESTLGTDMAAPQVIEGIDYVKPGRAAWSWAMGKDASVNYETQKKYIAYASDMGWEYCLVDVNWDTTIGWDKIADLAQYAKEKKVGLILWYNSAGDWNTVPYHPNNILNFPEKRREEFERLHKLGIKGIKVDFFGGDGQSMMQYYVAILQDAHKYQLMVNCHGATLPRGLQRTYPNLVSMESVRGFEYATFDQTTADRVALKSTILPFTRNAFDPMDFTPVRFFEYDNNIRKTGNGAELAQAVLFLSGVQHYAETPEGMSKVPDYVKEMIRDIPVTWDETRLVDAYPGKYVVLARRTGNTWYIAGINAASSPKDFEFTFPVDKVTRGTLITEADSLRSFRKEELKVDATTKYNVSVASQGGFVLRLTP